MEEDTNFSEKFKRVFNNADIPEADGFTPEVREYTYVYMEIALTRDGEGPEFSKVKKHLRYAKYTPIVRAHNNPVLGTIVYEVEYLDEHKE